MVVDGQMLLGNCAVQGSGSPVYAENPAMTCPISLTVRELHCQKVQHRPC